MKTSKTKLKRQQLEQQHSLECMYTAAPPRHTEIGTVPLPPAFSDIVP